MKGHRVWVWVLVLEGLVGLHRTVQLLQHYWSGHRRQLPWYWMVCLGNKQRSFCHFWACIQVLHFGLLLTMMAQDSKGFLPAVRIPLYSICLSCCDFGGLHQTTTHLLDNLLTLHGLRCYTRTPLTMWVLIVHPPNDFWTEVFRKRKDVTWCGREERGKERKGKRKRTTAPGVVCCVHS